MFVIHKKYTSVFQFPVILATNNMECSKLEYMIFVLLVVQLVYYSLKTSIEVLGLVGLRNKLNAKLEYVYNCCRPLTNRRNNVNVEQVEADVTHDGRDVEAGPIQELQEPTLAPNISSNC